MTRLTTFTYLPLLGLSFAFQTIVGNNFGAGQLDRARSTTKLAVAVAFGYCVTVQVGFLIASPWLGGVFVTDSAIQHELARILPITTLTLFIFGPQMMVARYFQAIGDARRAALLTLTRAFVFGIPLTLALPYLIGEPGIWYAGPLAESLLLALTVGVLIRLRKGS